MKSVLAGLACALLLVACDTVEGMREMKDAESEMKGLIREAIGVDTLVGFSIDNGVLIDVSVSFSASEVQDRSVAELVRATRSAVQSSFATAPRAIYIQIATSAD